MNCKFCGQSCTRTPVDESALHIERCYNHPYTVKSLCYKHDPDWGQDFMFVVIYKERKYVFTFSSSSDYGQYFELSCDGKWIFDMDGFPDITPENVLERLPTMIVFS